MSQRFREALLHSHTLLALGSVNADFQVRVDAAPGSAETLHAHDQCRLSGGKAANVAYLGRVFDCRVRLLASVGDDDLATQALRPLQDVGVDSSGVTRVDGGSTGVSMIMVPPDGKKHIVLATNANDDWSEAAMTALRDAIARAERPALLSLDYEVPVRVVHQAIETAHERGLPIVLDPSFPERVEQSLLDRITAITPNADEAETLTGITVDGPQAAARAARRLRELGVAIVCIKLSDGGCVLSEDSGTRLVPARDVEVVDTTGGGDAFTGVLAAALLTGHEPLAATARAVAAASLAVTAYGSQPAYPTLERIEALASQLLQRTRMLDD